MAYPTDSDWNNFENYSFDKAAVLYYYLCEYSSMEETARRVGIYEAQPSQPISCVTRCYGLSGKNGKALSAFKKQYNLTLDDFQLFYRDYPQGLKSDSEMNLEFMKEYFKEIKEEQVKEQDTDNFFDDDFYTSTSLNNNRASFVHSSSNVSSGYSNNVYSNSGYSSNSSNFDSGNSVSSNSNPSPSSSGSSSSSSSYSGGDTSAGEVILGIIAVAVVIYLISKLGLGGIFEWLWGAIKWFVGFCWDAFKWLAGVAWDILGWIWDVIAGLFQWIF